MDDHRNDSPRDDRQDNPRGTESIREIDIPAHSVNDLGFQALRTSLADFAQSEIGRARCTALPFLPDEQTVKRELRLVTEMVSAYDAGVRLSFEPVIDLSAATARLRKGGILYEEDLLSAARCLLAMAQVRMEIEAFEKKSKRAPRLARVAKRIDAFASLARDILGSFDESGRLRDDASPALFDARRHQATVRVQIRKLLDEYLKDPYIGECLQDDYFTLRDARYVLPIRASMQKRVPGIIQGGSNTGETVYIEPEQIVALNNQVMLHQEKIRAAELQVLTDLSGDLRDVADGIDSSQGQCVHLETVYARARLSLHWECAEPELSDDDGIDIRGARNPLLLRQKKNVVPNDFVRAPETLFLVISGPNAGGKTVSLDTLGLLFLMTAAGMHLPTAADARIFVPRTVYTLMSDAQDLERSLSTFTGQLRELEGVFRAAKRTHSAKGPGGQKASEATRDVLLIDEILAGTDPNEGAALAWAALEHAANLGITGAVTTHYELLKTLPYHDDRFVNAAMGLDPETQRPSFRLTVGAPGSSSPLRIAREVGFDPEIVGRASEILGSGDRKIDEIIRRMEDQTRSLELDRKRLTAERDELEETRRGLEEQLARVEKESRRLAMEQKERFLEKLRRHEEELKALTHALQDEKSPRTVRRVKVDLGKLKQDATRDLADDQRELAGAPQRAPAEPASIIPGAFFIHAKTGKRSEVVTVDRARKTCFVRIGALGMKARFKDLLTEGGKGAPAPTPRAPRKPQADSSSQGSSAPRIRAEDLIRTSDNSINLVGQRVDEAIALLDRRLDQAALADQDYLFIIHGVGSGQLRKALRRHLKESDYVRSFEPAPDQGGSDAVTLAHL